jgi:hypothetical protein
MSHDFDDSLLEEALRGDLPSPGTEQRVRKRLLAAGIAVGNGVAAGTAAAGGAASAGAPLGIAGKVLGASWGIKLGLAAAVAIPGLGLMLERAPARPPNVAVAARPTPSVPNAAPEERPRVKAEDMAAPNASNSAAPQPAAAPQRSQTGAPSDVVAGPAENAPPEPAQRAFAPFEPAPQGRATSTLAEETRLLDAAFAAIAGHDWARASELIRQHEDRYPSGLLTKERERAKVRLSELSRGNSTEGGR